MSKLKDISPMVGGPPSADQVRLNDENEQLRALLETALEENALLAEDRDQLRLRLQDLLEQLHLSQKKAADHARRIKEIEPAFERQSQTEEELRVAFEELQVLTEELESANSSLHRNNQELDARVEHRTRQLKEINDVLQATETSLQAVADLVPDLLWRTDSAGRADWFNQRWRQHTGLSAAELSGDGWLQVIHPADREAAKVTWSRAAIGAGAFEQEQRFRDEHGAYRWFLVRAEPSHDPQGKLARWFAAATDIHAQRSAMQALEHSERRFRTLIEGMPQLVWRAANSGHWTWSSPQWSDYTGYSESESQALGWLGALHPDDREVALKRWAEAGASGRFALEARFRNAASGDYRWFQTRATPVRDEEGAIIEWLGTSTDIHDLHDLQSRQKVLVAELQHRTRNLIGIVRSVADKTAANSSDLAEFDLKFHDRLEAMARVQGLLSRLNDHDRVTFDELIRTELAAMHGQSAKVSLNGPAGVRLRSSTVQTLAMALHELATNAVKYGALGQASARLDVDWVFEASGARGKPWLHITWRESGVSMPSLTDQPRGSGQGRELIERALPYQLCAQTAYELGSDGIRCSISIPVSETVEVRDRHHE